jgi:hypothetical protein
MNRMMQKPPMIAPMDLLGLSRRANPLRDRHDDAPFLTLVDQQSLPKYDSMTYTISNRTLGLKDSPASDGPMPSANFAEINQVLMELARKIDATFATLGADASIAQLVQSIMRDSTGPKGASLTDDPKMRVWLQADADYRAQQQCERAARAAAAWLATPESKKFVPGFQKVY